MHYVLLAVIIVIAAVVLLLGGNSDKKVTSMAGTGSANPTLSAVGAGGPGDQAVKTCSRAEIAKKLKALAQSPAPKELAMGAMCYKPAMSPTHAEYTCPSCGEKTVYPRRQNDQEAWPTIHMIERGLAACRRLVKEIKGLDIQLDESQFCQKCKPGIESPCLSIIIRYPGEKKEHRVDGVNRQDFKLLADFMAGKNKTTTDNDTEMPLKDHIGRLQELLGVK